MDFNKLAITAMTAKKRVALTYHGEPRLVEIHALGLSTKGKPCVRVYQVVGGSLYSETTGWKMLSLSEIEDAKLVDDTSLAPRAGYVAGDKGMSQILLEIENVEGKNPP
jgi:hypothetical protein